MKAIMVLLGIINVMLLLVNLYYFQYVPTSYIPKIPDGWGPLFAALIAVSGVLWQTGKGFSNLIESQNNQAEITRAQTNAANRYKQLEQERARADQRLSLLRTLTAEMRNGKDRLVELEKTCDELAASCGSAADASKVPALEFPKFECDLYRANLSKFDTMDPGVVEPIIRGYAILTHSLNLPVIDPKLGNPDLILTAFARTVEAGIAEIEVILTILVGKEHENRKTLDAMDGRLKALASPGT
ncbi:hypothetical protein [Rhizobium laguerreae]|uniref:hypothetical protein n=2 Tax=Rhizobium laguerreae TaxID=1076926 RepID=UPI001C922C0A|nr:hypothetical protein [Rhizobium laguerreae]